MAPHHKPRRIKDSNLTTVGRIRIPDIGYEVLLDTSYKSQTLGTNVSLHSDSKKMF